MADAPVLAPTVDDQIVVAQAAEPQTAAPVEVPAQNENMQAEKVIDSRLLRLLDVNLARRINLS